MFVKEQPSAIFASEVALRARLRSRTNARNSDPVYSSDLSGVIHKEGKVKRGGHAGTEEKKTPLFVRKFTQFKKNANTSSGGGVPKLTKEEQALKEELCSSLAGRNEAASLKIVRRSRNLSLCDGNSSGGGSGLESSTSPRNRRCDQRGFVERPLSNARVSFTIDENSTQNLRLGNTDKITPKPPPQSGFIKLFSPKTKRRLFATPPIDVPSSGCKGNGSPSEGRTISRKQLRFSTSLPNSEEWGSTTTKKSGINIWEWMTRSKDALLKYAQQGFSPQKEKGVEGEVEGSEGKKPRGVSLRRLSRSRQNNDRPNLTSDSNATQSDTEVGKISGPVMRVSNGNLAAETPLEMSRVGAWAASFEKLIEDPAGLHTFAEFLKKEYSHENIYFWTACERYRLIAEEDERREIAKAIFDRHLGMAASEPVNVDSHARQIAKEGLANPDEFLFSAAQKQIFNLMKFDSYSRFLKSDLYNKCLTQDRKGLPLPYPGDDTLDPDLGIFSENHFSKHLKKSKSDAEERRRKSLLPWHRKDRSKSKDRGEAEYWRRKKLGHRTPSDSSSARYDLSDSHTSLSSSDFAPANRAISKESLTSGEAVSLSGSEGLNLCRFILPDQSNSVLAVRSGETVKELVRQLLERRRINFTEFNVVLTKGNKIVDPNKDSTVLGGYEARLERMVLFSLYLPSRKTVIVKAKPHKLISEVLKPILTKYGLKLDLMVIHKYGESKGVSVKGPITDLDGEKLIVQTKEEIKEWSDPGRHSKRNNTLDEITNRVFEDLLNGKAKSNFDDLGILDFDSRSTKTDPTSDTSSSLLGSFSRRESLSLERNLPSRQSGTGRGLLSDTSFGGKRREPPTYNTKSKQENAELYEGLKRAQMCRLDDQRGTEINFELPDFLKSDRSQENNIST